jgi:hypothetical protein
MSTMRRLIYVSRWARPVADDVDVALMRIVARSIPNNRAASLTGFLVAADEAFLQVLEGPDAAVAETYARIAADPCHDRLRVIGEWEVSQRLFKDWNMGGVHLASDDEAWTTIRDGENFDLDAALDLLVKAALAEAERERRAALGVA